MIALVLGFLLALGQCLALGPVNTEALRRGLKDGFRASLAVELGSCFGDGLWAALAFAGLGALLTVQFMDVVGALLGVALLGWLAAQGWREAAVTVEPAGALQQRSNLPPFWAGILLGVVNPGSAAFWIGVGATLLSTHLPQAGPAALAQFAAGYYAALLLWSVGFSLIVWQMGLRLPGRVQLYVQRAAAALLAAFACLSLENLARRHLHA
jgi:threonine/homoserine/homoserine lactone efflux protein